MFISIFLTLKKYICKIYAYLWSLLFVVVKIYRIDTLNNTKHNLYYYYLLERIMCVFGISLSTVKHNIIKAEIYKDGITRDVIWQNTSLCEIVDKINDVIFDINETTMNKKVIVLNIGLRHTTGEYVNLKSLIDHYSDNSKLHSHTIQTLLKLKNIQWCDSDELIIEYIKLRKQTKKYPINTIIDKHIADFYDIN